MRILSIGAGLGRGGTERALVTFSTAYRRSGHDVAVLAWQEGGVRKERLEREGIEVHVGGANLRRALEAADAFNPDLIHIHRVGVARPIETGILQRLRTPRRRVIETNVFGRVDRSAAADCIDVHMHLSRWCLWRWRRWLGAHPRMPIGVVVPNPVEPEAFVPLAPCERDTLRAKLNIPADAFVCGRIGQPCNGKWHPATFRAFRAVAALDSRAHLLLRGLPPAMRRHLDRLPDSVRGRVIELPLVDTDGELARMYSLLDVFLHASRIGESFGYVLAEAMLCGCPVVTASTPHVDNSQVEVVGHLKGGIVAGSMDELPAALLYFRRSKGLREELRAGVREHVISRFEVDRMAALALRIGTLALQAGERRRLRERLAEFPECAPVESTQVDTLLSAAFGKPARLDLLAMRIRHVPQFQRAFDAHLVRRLSASIRGLVTDLEADEVTLPTRSATTGTGGAANADSRADTPVPHIATTGTVSGSRPPVHPGSLVSKRTRVLVSAYACGPGCGSEPGIGWNVARHLAEAHDVWLLTCRENEPAIRAELRSHSLQGLHVVFMDTPWFLAWAKRTRVGYEVQHYFWQAAAFFCGRRLHRALRFDLAHHVTMGRYWSPSFLSLLPIPFVWGPVGGGESVPRGFWRHLGARGILLELAREGAHRIGELDPFLAATARRAVVGLATSEESQTRLTRLGARAVRVVSQVGLPDSELALLDGYRPADATPVRFISIGRLLHWKGFQLGLLAFARVSRPDAEYWIVGTGPARRFLANLAKKLGVADRVRFCGALPRSDSLACLAQAHVLVHPSLHESGGMVCLEAMAAGRPVICLDLGGPALQVTRATGFKIAARDPEQAIAGIADAMTRLALSPQLRARMGEAARARAAEFNWRRKGQQLVTLYAETACLPALRTGT